MAAKLIIVGISILAGLHMFNDAAEHEGIEFH
jgi:hypothetical protein